ncbi:MAG: hypothetical protein A3F78_22405 [Burkholderiales bacterium RIFCSPLOWO2_12_FULL_61_40]|nr:MAG: hypothetical protein A3F78_22405 [Burkholderiales bacterium RIFCSPLOWO2_12_FULL_61_40]
MTSHRSKSLLALSTVLGSLLLTACGEKPEALLASAKSYLDKNESKAAIIQVKNALQVNPDMPEARFLLGKAMLESGDFSGAEAELRKALHLKYPLDSVAPPLAKALLAKGQAKMLIDEFGKTELTQGPAQANLLTSLVTAYAMQGNMEQSKASLNAALAAQPGYPPALMQQAREKASQHDFDGALDLIDEVISKSPESHEAWKLKGDIHLYAKGEISEALTAYQKTIQIKHNFLAGRSAIITILLLQGKQVEAEEQIAQLKKIAPNHPRTLYHEAQLAFRKKDFELAKTLAQQVLSTSPADIPALQLAGTIALQLNSLPQAQDYLNRALKAVPTLTVARRLLVVTYLRSGQTAKAMEALLPGLRMKPIDPHLLPVAGEVYLQSGDPKKAEEYFTQASQQTPGNAKNRTSLALVQMLNGSPDSAFEELHDIAMSDTGTTADMALISVHLSRREFDKALQAIDALEKKQPGKPLAPQLRAQTLLAKKDVAGARKSFEHALAADPNYFPAVAGLAGLDLADKNPEKARMRINAVLANDPKNSQALLALAEIAVQSGASDGEVAKLIGNAVATNPTNVKLHVLLIDFYMRHKDTKGATSAAQNAVAAMPDNPQLLDALGRTQQLSGDLLQAMATYTKLANLQPQSPLPLMRLAGVHIAAKDMQAAYASLRKALVIQPDLLDVQRAVISLDLGAKRFQDAMATARTVQKQRATEAVGYLLEGDIHAYEKHWERAAEAYRAGLKQVNSTELALKLHTVLVAGGKGTEADKFSALWQKANPKDAAFLLYLGDAAIAHNDYSTAENKYATVVQLQPNSAIAYNNLAWVSGKLKKESAIAYAEKAVSLAPQQAAFMDTLAFLLSDKGDYVKALDLQNKAVAMQPTNALFRLNLAKIHLRGGNKELARKELDALSKLGDKFSAQPEVISLLKTL